MKSFALLIVLLKLPISSASQGSSVKSVTSIEVVADVVSHDDWNGCDKPGQMFGMPVTDLMKQRFTEAFVKDWSRITKAAKESPVLDGDVLTGTQGISGLTFESAQIKKQTATKADVQATFHYFEDEAEGRPKKTKNLSFYLMKENGLWKVDDYEYEDWTGQPATEKTVSTLKSVKSTFRKVHSKDH